MIITSSKIIGFNNDFSANRSAVVIKNGIVVGVGSTPNILKKFPRHQVIRLERSVLIPGLINVHTHLELLPLLETLRSKAFPDWVLNLIKAKKELTSDDYKTAAENNIKDLIQTGTTTVAEICTHNVSPAILKNAGLRSIIFHEVISMNPMTPMTGLSSRLSRPSSLIRSGLSPHAPHTVSEKVLFEIKELAMRKKLPLCMHVAESKDEIRLLQRKKNDFEKLYRIAGWDLSWAPLAESPFVYLHKLGMLGPRFLAVHAVQATDGDIGIIRTSRTPIAHCPRSNRETGVGRMRLKEFLDAGITVGLGTDSLASSPSLNMWDEMRYALKIHKKDGITARDIFTLATLGGAKALGLDKEIGSLEPGKRADIVAVPLPAKDTGDIYSDLLREMKSCIMSMVNGKILYRKQP
jgi:cytosine/adenosine deaminase-related metal-dependent hydrolase